MKISYKGVVFWVTEDEWAAKKRGADGSAMSDDEDLNRLRATAQEEGYKSVVLMDESDAWGEPGVE